MTPSSDGILESPLDLFDILRGKVANLLGCEKDEVDSAREFTSYGLSSIEGLSLLGDLEELVEMELPDSLLWDYPSLGQLADHLRRRLADADAGNLA